MSLKISESEKWVIDSYLEHAFKTTNYIKEKNVNRYYCALDVFAPAAKNIYMITSYHYNPDIRCHICSKTLSEVAEVVQKFKKDNKNWKMLLYKNGREYISL